MPNSLTELNQYANTSIVYTDDRAYSITFSANAASNTSTTIDEDDSFVVPTGIDITSVISQPGNITYTINASTANIVGTWPDPLPAGISNTSTGNGVYSITGIFDADTWNQAKNIVVVAPDRETPFTFVGNIQYPSTANTSVTNSWSWTNSVTIANLNPDLSLTTSYTWAEDQPTAFVYEVEDLDPTAILYTLTFDQFSGTSGIITVNGASAGIGNTAVLTGNRATVNAATVVFNPYPDATDNVQVYVSAVKTNPFGNVTFASNVVANLNCTSTHAEYSLPTSYDENTFTSKIEITDTDPNASEYTISIQQTAGNTGSWFVNGNLYSTASNVYTVSTSRDSVNAANIVFFPEIGYTGNVNLTYNQSKNNSLFGNIVQASNVVQTLAVGTTYPMISNMIDRSYDSNTVNSIFSASTPAIADGPDYGQLYTITLNSSLGRFGNTDAAAYSAANTYSFTGNITSVNAEFAAMKFLPFPGESGNGTFTYTQARSGVSQINSTHNLTGTAVPFAAATYTFGSPGSYSWTPTVAETYYGNAQILVVGAGGGGGGGNTYVGGGGYAVIGGGGGGAGGVVSDSFAPNTYLTGTWNITVGTGGVYRSGHTDTAPSTSYSFGSDGTGSGLSNGTNTYGGNGGQGGRVSGDNADNKGGASGAGGGSVAGSPIYDGGIGADFDLGGGGGGAGSVGGNAVTSTSPGAGGGGITSSISGTSVTYSRGGAGGEVGIGPSNGATPGSGGSGGGVTSSSNGNGANGIVIIKVS